jgi:hypothetical protein
MRDRYHTVGGFEDEDGSSPINVWLLAWDDTWVRVDFVIELLPPSVFLGRVFDGLARAIADSAMRVERDSSSFRYFTPMDAAWVRASWPEIMLVEANLLESLGGHGDPARDVMISENPDARETCLVELRGEKGMAPSIPALVERCLVRLLGYWHRVFYPGGIGDEQGYAMPPGDLRYREGCVEIQRGGRKLTWTVQDTHVVPAAFNKTGDGRLGRS